MAKRQAQSLEAQIAQADIDRRAAEMAMPTPQEIKDKITDQEVMKAAEILRKYKEGKAHLENKIIANEQMWKLHQWEEYKAKVDKNFKPKTAWLWSSIISRHADVMDSYPTCNFRPRQEDDKAEAKRLSSIVPVILEQNHYEETYSDVALYMLKQGGCVQGIFWDTSKLNGLGDISVKKIDLINLFWEPGITDIQESENLFNTELVSNRILEQRYPQCVGKLGGQSISLAKYLYDDNVSTDGKSVVVDWYYHTEYNGKKVLQYCKFVNNIVLYATENDTEVPTADAIDPVTQQPIKVPTGPSMAERGLYDHGLYPFVCQALYPIEGSICGLGVIDVARDAQMQIDVMNHAVTSNTALGAKPRYFSKNNGAINMEEYTDYEKDIVNVSGSLDETNIRLIETKPLSPTYVDVLSQKIDELKYVTANQDVNNGAAPNGITAASAIAALQETSGKVSRNSNKVFYRAFREVCSQIVELIRQFYDVPRTFRIAPDSMGEEFVQYSNAGLTLQTQNLVGMPMGLRKPEFDISITAEKANPYKKMEQNELALNFYNLGFFNPQMSDQALACLEMMDFTGKDEIMQRIRSNGTLLEMLTHFQQVALTLAQKYEPKLVPDLANIVMGQGGQPLPSGEEVNLETNEEPTHMAKAREQARETTQAE